MDYKPANWDLKTQKEILKNTENNQRTKFGAGDKTKLENEIRKRTRYGARIGVLNVYEYRINHSESDVEERGEENLRVKATESVDLRKKEVNAGWE